MKTNKSVILAGTALAGTAVAGLFAGTAMAQSTGSQAVEVIIKGGPRSNGGLDQATTATKDQSIINKDYLDSLGSSASFGDAINLVPGVSYSNEDASGMNYNGDLRIHGFDGAHTSVTIDGVPVNDSGNYAIYPNEYSVNEAIDHITVNLGQTEVDSPTASAIGGAVNIVSKVPDATPSFGLNLSAGDLEYQRVYADVQTGAVGPTGLRNYFSIDEASTDKFKGLGSLKRWGVDGRVYQPLDNGGFLSIAYTYNQTRQNKYYDGTPTNYAQYGDGYDYNTSYAPETVTPGTADKVGSGTAVVGQSAYQAGTDAYYYDYNVNFNNFGAVRGQSKFNFGDKATLTVDPYFVYDKGGSGDGIGVYENDTRLIGTATSYPTCNKVGKAGQTGVDLNGDGDCLDQVLLYNPIVVTTYRYGVNSSFIYHFTETQTLQVTGTVDDAHLRQTSPYSLIDPATGAFDGYFGAADKPGDAIRSADGTILEYSNRYSIAKLNQISLNYLGRFFDDKLHINVGIRDPHFQRKLNEYCYMYNDTSEYCNSVALSTVQAAIAKDQGTGKPATVVAGSTKASATSTALGTTVYYSADGTVNIRTPFAQTVKYDKILPNVGLSYDFDAHNAIYATYAAGFSAPTTTDLYSTGKSAPLVPETTDLFGAGYRFRTAGFDVSVNPWAATWHNHIVYDLDPDFDSASVRSDRNVGEVKLYGVDVESSWKVTPNFSLYGSAAYNHSAMQSNRLTVFSAGPDKNLTQSANGQYVALLPTKGKQLVMTPDETYSVRASYHKDAWGVDVTAKYTGRRFISDVNDAFLKAYEVVNFDAYYKIDGLGKGARIQLNVTNLLSTQYYSRVSSTVNAVNDITLSNGDKIYGNTAYYRIAAPAEAVVELKTRF